MGGGVDGWPQKPRSPRILPYNTKNHTKNHLRYHHTEPLQSQVGNRDLQRGNDSDETTEDSRGTAMVGAPAYGPHGRSPGPRSLKSEPGPMAPRVPPSPHRAGAFLKPQPGEARRDSHVVERRGAGNSLGAGRGSPRRPGGGVTLLCLSGLVRQAGRPWLGDRGSGRGRLRWGKAYVTQNLDKGKPHHTLGPHLRR